MGLPDDVEADEAGMAGRAIGAAGAARARGAARAGRAAGIVDHGVAVTVEVGRLRPPGAARAARATRAAGPARAAGAAHAGDDGAQRADVVHAIRAGKVD